MTDLPAGRELDFAVHEIMTGERRPYAEHRAGSVPTDWELSCPHYSNDIAAAWTVVEKLFADGVADTVHVWKDGAIFLNDREPVSQHGEGPAPLAICRAALRAVESAR